MAIPGFVPMFFDGGPISVFANKRGGAKAAAIICFFTGIVHIALGAVAASFFQLTSFGGWHGNFDFSTFWLLSGGIMKYVGIIAIPIIIIALLIIPQIQYMRNKEKYFTYAAKND
jgi:PTS system ascorbate-specific IIC component